MYNIKLEKCKKIKLEYILGSLYWISLIIFFFYYIIYGVFVDTIIVGSSFVLFVFCFTIMPICLLLLPLVINSKFKKGFNKSIVISFLVTIIYILVIVPTLQFGIKKYLSVFTIDKWKNIHQYHRYFMIEDFEKKYNLIGMTKQEVFKILGKENINDALVIEYYIGDGGRNSIYYNVYLNEKNEVIDAKVERINYD